MGKNLEKILIRRVGKKDTDILWGWVNDTNVRSNSLNSESIGKISHQEWLNNKIQSKDTVMYILESEGIPFSQIRFDRVNQDDAEIDISVAKEFRSQGLGTLTLINTRLKAIEHLGIIRLIGTVLETNKGSCKAFINAGFRENNKRDINGNMCRVFHWESDQKLPLGD
jgi:RimJ/RimL family protein N-acetyltransferase